MKKKKQKKEKSSLREWINSILWAVVLVFIIRNFIVQPFKIPTGSMEPTLLGIEKVCPVCHRNNFRYDEKICPYDGARLKTIHTGDRILVNKFIYGAKTPDRIPFTATLLPFLQLPALRSPRRGDIVVFHYPGDLKIDYVKRLIGLPGETLEVKNGRVLINGNPVTIPQCRAIYYTNEGSFARKNQPITIPFRGMTVALNEQNADRWARVIRNEGHSLETGNGQVLIDGKPARNYRVEQDYYFVMGDNSSNSADSRFWGFVPKKDMVGEVFGIYWPPCRWGLVN